MEQLKSPKKNSMLSKVLQYLWQLPQNLLGLFLLILIKGEQRHSLYDIDFYYAPNFNGGISLGKYIILSNKREKSIRHEWGHCIQSKILGWFYLPVVGLWSGLHCAFCKCIKHSYYDIWCEKWADKLGGVQR